MKSSLAFCWITCAMRCWLSCTTLVESPWMVRSTVMRGNVALARTMAPHRSLYRLSQPDISSKLAQQWHHTDHGDSDNTPNAGRPVTPGTTQAPTRQSSSALTSFIRLR